MKETKCPNCNNYGKAPNFDQLLDFTIEHNDRFAFRQRGQIDGYPIWICNKCNIVALWMKIGFFGKPKSITGYEFQNLKEEWERGTGLKF